ncbi:MULTISPECIES: acetyl-CoA carboxylase biotin carboxylase subunit family protein [unclassified Streptomyces]|uniref:ATP-grasp domain-containing protein n=1 Tax=unclassified Streptomyces TaxID=2593676 RepID=UPI0016608D1B|nr:MULTISPECIES: ATP-grasp domain-containing protein [unclassified Streptomyces]MBD0711495.1 biotin carboxylase [Streptomyces sp. CBMA291]MBD0716030.1 biotin carboxylase [Streptomyces sp. CBMA370]
MNPPILLVVDYNLSRIDEVRHLRNHARDRHGATVILIRADPTDADRAIADEVIDLDPLRDDFAEMGEKLLADRRDRIRAGIVFSDNAVHSGADLLRRLGVPVDSPRLAGGAFSKYRYRLTETRVADFLEPQRIMVPAFAEIASLDQLRAFARDHPEGFVVKPAAEGNNRGVVVVRHGDDLTAVFAEVLPYLEGGVICEELIPYRREYSHDGLGSLEFLTEKISATGRYPVEVAQVLPARLDAHERATLHRAGRQANWLVGQCDGPFHNEIKLSDDGLRAAVVEPNRRPGGMKIWSLAHWVYGIDLHHRWIDTAFGTAAPVDRLVPGRAAATVLLGVATDRSFHPDDIAADTDPFADAVRATAERFGLADGELTATAFTWLSHERRDLHAVARDNADFAAQGCVVLRGDRADIRTVVHTLRDAWQDALDRALTLPTPVRKA